MVQVFGYALTKHDGGHLRGNLTPWRPCLPHQHCRHDDNEERGKQPLHLRSVDNRGQELGTLGGCFKTRQVGPERLCLANLRSSGPWPIVKFQSNLDRAYGEETPRICPSGTYKTSESFRALTRLGSCLWAVFLGAQFTRPQSKAPARWRGLFLLPSLKLTRV